MSILENRSLTEAKVNNFCYVHKDALAAVGAEIGTVRWFDTNVNVWSNTYRLCGF
jgi:hypothetical protein